MAIWKPARRNSSTVAFSRLPLGIPILSFNPSVPIDGTRIVSPRLALYPLAVIETAKEAALIAFVAHAGTERFHLDQHGVAVAIGGNVFHHQAMSRGFAFEPQLVARSAE